MNICENRVPKYHHPKVQGIFQKSIYIIDEPVKTCDGDVLPGGTCFSCNSGGMGKTGRRSWHVALIPSGRQVSIPVE